MARQLIYADFSNKSFSQASLPLRAWVLLRCGKFRRGEDRSDLRKQVIIHALVYGLCGGILIVLLKLIEFRFLIVDRALEIYGGLIAVLFASLGIWLGLRLTRKRERVVIKEIEVPVPVGGAFVLNEQRRRDLGVTGRELEILELIANGLSNRKIADKLYVSENTVKTHSSRLFDKLGVKRRTQAVQVGKEMGLIP